MPFKSGSDRVGHNRATVFRGPHRQAGITSMMLADVRVGRTRVKRKPAVSRRMRYSSWLLIGLAGDRGMSTGYVPASDAVP